jgi:hypothetical protein
MIITIIEKKKNKSSCLVIDIFLCKHLWDRELMKIAYDDVHKLFMIACGKKL